MSKEKWKDMPDFEGKYEVSNMGSVRGWYYGGRKRIEPRTKKPQRNKNGYFYVVLEDGDRYKSHLVHRLVLSVFDKPMPRNIDCRHKNHRRDDNRLSNLEWGTRKQNEKDKAKAGRSAVGERNGAAKMTNEIVAEIRKLFNDGMSTNAIAKSLGLKQQNVWFICNNKTWKHI